MKKIDALDVIGKIRGLYFVGFNATQIVNKLKEEDIEVKLSEVLCIIDLSNKFQEE